MEWSNALECIKEGRVVSPLTRAEQHTGQRLAKGCIRSFVAFKGYRDMYLFTDLCSHWELKCKIRIAPVHAYPLVWNRTHAHTSQKNRIYAGK